MSTPAHSPSGIYLMPLLNRIHSQPIRSTTSFIGRTYVATSHPCRCESKQYELSHQSLSNVSLMMPNGHSFRWALWSFIITTSPTLRIRSVLMPLAPCLQFLQVALPPTLQESICEHLNTFPVDRIDILDIEDVGYSGSKVYFPLEKQVWISWNLRNRSRINDGARFRHKCH